MRLMWSNGDSRRGRHLSTALVTTASARQGAAYTFTAPPVVVNQQCSAQIGMQIVIDGSTTKLL